MMMIMTSYKDNLITIIHVETESESIYRFIVEWQKENLMWVTI